MSHFHAYRARVFMGMQHPVGRLTRKAEVFFMALSRSSRRIARVMVGVGISALAFAGVMLAPRAAQAQERVYVYGPRPGPPPPAYGYSYGPRYGYGRPYYYQEPQQATVLGFDVEGAVPLNPPNAGTGQPAAVGGGGGFKVRLGEQFRFPGIRLTPEVGYGYDHLWAADNLGNGYGWDMNRLFAGARLGFGRILVPTIYAHLGYGWRQTSATYITGQDGGVAFDVGGALDLRVIPHFGIGVHLEYSQIVTDVDTPQWLAIGAHADIIF
jgi:hypothetical protein